MARRPAPKPLRIAGEDVSPPPPKQSDRGSAPKVPMSFDAWWILRQTQYKLSPQLKEAVKLHLQARGFMESEDFDEGLIDFGIKP